MRALDFLSSVRPAATPLQSHLVRWAEQNSGSENLVGLAAMHALLARDFSTTLGIPAESLPLDPYLSAEGEPTEVGAALRLRKHPEAPLQVLLNGHMDTVFGLESPFQKCTEQPEGRLNGPGVADMKGGLLIMLRALEILEGSRWAGQLGWTVLITADEEIGSPASHALIAAEAARHQLGMVFESALPGGEMVVTRKGNGRFRATATGRAAHTGRDPEHGRNAIVHLARWIDALESLPTEFPGLTLNVGRIRGGGALNIVPDEAIAEWNLRLPASADPSEVEAAIHRRTEAFNRGDGFALRWEGRFTRPPLDRSPAREPLMRAFTACAEALGLPLGGRDTGGGSDGNLLHAAGLPVLDGIGVRGGDLHQESEFIIVESLVERVELSALFLLRLAAGEIAIERPI